MPDSTCPARYFDHNATTPPDPAVIEAMARALTEDFGNRSSVHHFGQQAKALLDEARTAVAELIGARAGRGRLHQRRHRVRQPRAARRRGSPRAAAAATPRRHVITTSIEHEAVLNTVKALARRGWTATLLPVDATGIVAPAALAVGDHARDRHRLGDARQQRDRHGPAGRRPRGDRARARRALPHRRGAVGRQDPGRRPRARRRSAVALGAQVLRPEGRRRAVDPPRHAPGVDHDRRQARAQSPRRHRERPGLAGLASRRGWRGRS